MGIQGNTGYSFGDHVHYEVRVGSSPVNPQGYLNSGTLAYPMSSFTITQGYGYTQYGYLYVNGFHTGIDMAGPAGSPVYAACNGTVILNQYYGGYGHAYAVECDDNGLVVLFGHLR